MASRGIDLGTLIHRLETLDSRFKSEAREVGSDYFPPDVQFLVKADGAESVLLMVNEATDIRWQVAGLGNKVEVGLTEITAPVARCRLCGDSHPYQVPLTADGEWLEHHKDEMYDHMQRLHKVHSSVNLDYLTETV